MRSSRRDFLKLAPGLASLAMLPSRSFAATTTASGRISLGHSLYGMQTVPLNEAVAQCARIGFRNVELVLDSGFPCAPAQFSRTARQELRRQLEGLGLEVSALMRNIKLVGGLTPAQNAEAIKEAAGVAHDLSPGGARPPLETTLGGKPEEWESLRNQMVDLLGGWATAAQSAGFSLVVKAHMNNAVDTPEKLLWLLQKVPSPALAATYDYSHYEAHGLPLESSWATLAAHTKFVHVKDSRTEAGKSVFLLPGEGRVDYPKLFRLMTASGYKGAVVAEVSSMIFKKPGYDPIATAQKCHDVLSRALDEAGVPHA
jgi:inosose dehydratase